VGLFAASFGCIRPFPSTKVTVSTEVAYEICRARLVRWPATWLQPQDRATLLEYFIGGISYRFELCEAVLYKERKWVPLNAR
jgi:hypothetical protein